MSRAHHWLWSSLPPQLRTGVARERVIDALDAVTALCPQISGIMLHRAELPLVGLQVVPSAAVDRGRLEERARCAVRVESRRRWVLTDGEVDLLALEHVPDPEPVRSVASSPSRAA